MAQVNARLAEVFQGFALWREGDAIRIEPLLHMSVARALLDEGRGEPGSPWAPWLMGPGAEPPPMPWLDIGKERAPSRNVDYSDVNGATIEDEAFVATGVSVFPGASVGRGSEVRVNAVVHVNSTLTPGTTVPIGWVAADDPAELFSPDRHEELWAVQERMDFPGTVFGLPRAEAAMERVARRYSQSVGRHRGDRVLRT